MLEDQIYREMKEFAPEAGALILNYRGKVVNVGKDSDLQDENTIAKTVVDEMIQELWLSRLSKVSKDVRINVEEETSLRKLFKNEEGITVHQDPLDGTKAYLDGSDRFTTGYGISDENDEFTHSVIFAPAFDVLFCASPIECKRLGKYEVEENMKKVFVKRAFNENWKEKNDELDKKGRELLRENGFEPSSLGSCHLSVIDVALGNAGALVYRGSNPHDSMIPYAFARAYGVDLVDLDGNPITGKDMRVKVVDGFTKFERLDNIVYFSREFLEEDREKLLELIN